MAVPFPLRPLSSPFPQKKKKQSIFPRTPGALFRFHRPTRKDRLCDSSSPLPPSDETVFELAKQLPDYGVGSKFALKKWERKGAPNSYWTVTRMVPRPTGRSGKVFGTFTWKGELKYGGAAQKVAGCTKAGIWKVLKDDTPISGPVIKMPETSDEGEAAQAEEPK